MSLSGRCAFITGATSGIGQATARSLAEAGCHLVICGRRSERLQNLVTAYGAKVQVLPLVFDVCNRDQMLETLAAHKEALNNVDILVNNAGLALGADKAHAANTDDWDAMIDTNIKALFHMTRWFLPQMRESGSADIVNLGSVAGRYVYPGGAVYCATKFAVRAFSEGLRLDLQGSGVRVINIEPGMVETEFSEVRFKDKKIAKDVYRGMSPLTADDIAQSIVWTLSQPRHVNIQELVVYPTDQSSPGSVHRRPTSN